MPCTPEIFKKNANQVDTQNFITEHVFEAQTLGSFFQFLTQQAAMPIGYTAASNDWVSEALLGIDLGVNGAYILPSTTSVQNMFNEATFRVCAQGLGNTNNLQDLTLSTTYINSAKATWFGGGTPGWTGKNERQAKLQIRNVAGTFSYLQFSYPGGNTGTTKAIWDKFMRPANWIDLVLSRFDGAYTWGSRTGEPVGPHAQLSIRYLYTYWIDLYLGTIESNARGWSASANTYFQNQWSKNTASGQSFYAGLFGQGGLATAAQMTFPRPGGGGSVYGVWGNPSQTVGSNGGLVTLPPPAP
ncbi:MAG: hypothetical protein MMC33_005892 [Icmadophila ericetorum]|nr:hypothetical protein [Icmadophila ericetorum]